MRSARMSLSLAGQAVCGMHMVSGERCGAASRVIQCAAASNVTNDWLDVVLSEPKRVTGALSMKH